MGKKIIITSDCVCDLPTDMLEQYDIEIIYFYVWTDNGCFRDRDEISARNVVEYFTNGGQHIQTTAPEIKEYKEFFGDKLEKYDEVLHISIASTLSKSFENASEAAKDFSGRVTVFNSEHLSTGIGHLVIKAASLASENRNASDIVTVLEEMKNKISTSFIAKNADYLHRTGRVNKFVRDVCTLFQIHPVLGMKNGVMKLKSAQIGDFEKSVLRYARKEMREAEKINKKRVFITHTVCSVKLISAVKKEITKKCGFEQIIVSNASATISSNCGADTIGVLWVKN